MTLDRAELTPNQISILDDLLAIGVEGRPRNDLSLAGTIKGEMERVLEPCLEQVGRFAIGKYALSQFHTCEGRYLAGLDGPGFAWSKSTIRGQIVHRAIEASVGLIDPVPRTLVERTIAAMRDEDGSRSLWEFIQDLSEVERSLAIGEATDSLSKFLMDWPPLDATWRPRAESATSARLFGGKILLRAKYDLVLFQPKADECRVVIVDFKTGGEYPHHRDEVRYYALVETLVRRVAPFRVASYYLDEARFSFEDVTPELLRIASRRVVDAVRNIGELLAKVREPVLTPGSWCRYCDARDSCETGIAHLAGGRAGDDWQD